MDEFDFRDFRVEEDLIDTYDELVERPNSPFEKQEKSDLFVFAAAVGWEAGLRQEMEGIKVLFGKSSLDATQETILKSIAVAETNEAETLNDGVLIREIAEEYANGGMYEIRQLRDGPDDLIRELSNRMIEVADEFDL